MCYSDRTPSSIRRMMFAIIIIKYVLSDSDTTSYSSPYYKHKHC